MFTGRLPSERLDHTDAQFVDVVHTDIDGNYLLFQLFCLTCKDISTYLPISISIYDDDCLFGIKWNNLNSLKPFSS